MPFRTAPIRWLTVAGAAAAIVVLWLWLGDSRLTVLVTIVGAFVPILVLLPRWLAPAPSQPKQIDAAAEALTRSVRKQWVAEQYRRGLEDPHSMPIQWSVDPNISGRAIPKGTPPSRRAGQDRGAVRGPAVAIGGDRRPGIRQDRPVRGPDAGVAGPTSRTTRIFPTWCRFHRGIRRKTSIRGWRAGWPRIPGSPVPPRTAPRRAPSWWSSGASCLSWTAWTRYRHRTGRTCLAGSSRIWPASGSS